MNVDRLRVDFKGMEGLFSKMDRRIPFFDLFDSGPTGYGPQDPGLTVERGA